MIIILANQRLTTDKDVETFYAQHFGRRLAFATPNTEITILH